VLSPTGILHSEQTDHLIRVGGTINITTQAILDASLDFRKAPVEAGAVQPVKDRSG